MLVSFQQFIQIVILFVTLSLVSVQSKVFIDFGHFKEPFLREEGETTYLKNSNIRVQIRCRANYPTQWVNNLDEESKNAEGRILWQWSDRKFSGSIDDGVYDYLAWLHLQHTTGLKEPETFVCVGVNDTSNDQKTLVLKPLPDNTLSITKINGPVATNDGDDEDSGPNCEVQFLFLDGGVKGRFWRCQGDDGSPGRIRFSECGSAMVCENSYRNVKKLSKCLEILEEPIKSLQGWTPMNMETSYSSGTVLCSHRNTLRAQPYFYSTPVSPGNKLRKIELSVANINPSGLVWLDKLGNDYYTGDKLQAKCHFPKYGFSFDPYGALVHNDIRIILKKSIENHTDNTWIVDINHELTEAGTYVIQCLGPVWNTAEWVNKTNTIIVKDVVAPSFQKEFEEHTFIDGTVGEKLRCTAKGDPKPTITWENANIPVISTNGAELIFRKVADYITGPYVCVASNRFGQTARKIFSVIVRPKVVESGISISIIIGIAVAVIMTLLIVIGFVIFYRKFRKLSGQIAYLTYEEVGHFRDGKQTNAEQNENNASIDCLPYNSKYEVSRDKICVDENAVLGSGAYGTVMKGTIILNSGERTAVAFKTVPRSVDVSYFKALLSELKILAFIGEHENIVGLVGAWTANIKHREIFVGVELCKTSLVQFLNDNANQFTDYFKNSNSSSGRGGYQNFAKTTFSTIELIQWADDIATGMDYLASKKVVHGDLAARNILLSFDTRAKICDFGLARQLIDYNYIKSQTCPLPWKWMAIESLNRMRFSTQSDAWAYGITLWEIFSLGKIPYPGLTWSPEFVEKLEEGLRMSSPPYANDIIYNLMVTCWKSVPKLRPSFSEISKVLQIQCRTLSTTLGQTKF